MTNAAVIARMAEMLDRYETGQISVWDIEKHFEMHLSALEGLASRQIDLARDLVHSLVLAFIDESDEDPAVALARLRDFVGDLPR